MQSCAAEPERSAALPAMVSSIRSTARYLSRSTAASYRCSCCKKRIDVDRQNPSRFTTAFENRFFAAKLSQGRILGDFWRDRRQFSGEEAWRLTHLLLYQRQKNAAHGAPSGSGTQQKLPKRSDKPGVAARAKFPLHKALPQHY